MKPSCHADREVTTSRRRPFWTLCVPALLIAGALAALYHTQHRQPRLMAAAGAGTDQDNDGLTDLQELILGTNPLVADTDSDTYCDLEEIARQSDPLSQTDIPQSSAASIGMFAREDLGHLIFGSAVYMSGPGGPSLQYELGVVLQGIRAVVPAGAYLGTAVIGLKQAHDPGAMILTIESGLPTPFVKHIGSMALYAFLRDKGAQGEVVGVDVLNLTDVLDTLFLIEPIEDTTVGPGPINASTLGPSGLVYIPLTTGENLPSTFTAGEICWQSVSTVGVNGASYVQEVEGAECEPADSYCSGSGCASSVGQTIEIVDPALLIGG